MASASRPTGNRVSPCVRFHGAGRFLTSFSPSITHPCWCSLEDAGRVFDLPEDGVTGIKVKLHDPFGVNAVAAQLSGAARDGAAEKLGGGI